ncbi:uncharacterized protein [Apostichopus japonicus]|uniref:uncharacterized protein isoform X1 n=1 Tax=Stichopus japonicus TaxID=307972 RepID=UPI003AB91943
MRVTSLAMLCWVLLCLSFLDTSYASSMNITAVVNTSVSLSCVVGELEQSIWLYYLPSERRGSQLTVSDKYEFMYAVVENCTDCNTYDLIIPVLSEEMSGRFECQEAGEIKESIFLTVEVPPTVELQMNNSIVNKDIVVKLNDALSILCVAKGGEPPVTLGWEINGQRETSGVSVNTSRANERMSISQLIYIPTLEDNVITCFTAGQVKAASVRTSTTINVQYAPICSSQLAKDNSRYYYFCQCIANPEAKNISVLVNGAFYSNELTIKVTFTYAVNLSCLAFNDVGKTETGSKLYMPPVTVFASTTTLLYTKRTIETTPLKEQAYTPAYNVTALLVFGAVIMLAIVVFVTLKRTRAARHSYSSSHRVDVTLSAKSQREMQHRPLPQIQNPAEYARRIDASQTQEYMVIEDGIYAKPYETIDEPHIDEDGYLKTKPQQSVDKIINY